MKAPQPDLGIVVVIPCYHEPDLITSLESLNNCSTTSYAVEIIVIINQSKDCSEEVSQFNLATFQAAKKWAESSSSDQKEYYILFEDQLPAKHAGVGLARKIGMDEAVRRFEKIEKPGIIVCFDADCTCQPNYLNAIETHFRQRTKSTAATIYFEHSLNGPLPPAIYDGIKNYELFLRYYRQALIYCGYPYAYFTIGSCLAVRSDSYQKQGGMNRRKAGEDFYFVEEHCRMGTITQINTTTVFPSPRVSDRVPFGTGKRQSEWMLSDQQEYLTFDPNMFQLLQVFLNATDKYYEMSFSETQNKFGSFPVELQNYLTDMHAANTIEQCRKQTKQLDAFKKCFFLGFDGLWILQFLHHFQKEHLDVDLSAAAQWILKKQAGITMKDATISGLLKTYRTLDKGLDEIH
ncbi:MAG: glycosyltransferase [Cyclobacteriaceae bacterium]